MTHRPAYTVGPDVSDEETLRDSRGRIIDDAYAEAAAEEALATVRRRGRPSLSRSGQSPLLRVRLSSELDDAITHAAQKAGISRAEWVRQAITQAIRKAS